MRTLRLLRTLSWGSGWQGRRDISTAAGLRLRLAGTDGCAGARGQSGFARAFRGGVWSRGSSHGSSARVHNSGGQCARGGRIVRLRVVSGELRGAAVARWRAGRVGRRVDKVAGLGTRRALGAPTARPRVPWSACPERANCRQRGCRMDALVHWGLSWRSNLVQEVQTTSNLRSGFRG